MSSQHPWPEPSWLAEIPDETERAKAQVQFYMALAAIYCTRNGHLDALAKCLGKPSGSVRTHRWKGKPSAELAIGIERTLGRELFPRELFRPDLFVIEG